MEIEGVTHKEGADGHESPSPPPQHNHQNTEHHHNPVKHDHHVVDDSPMPDVPLADDTEHVSADEKAPIDSDSPLSSEDENEVDATDRPSTPPATSSRKRKLADLHAASRSPSGPKPISPPWKSFAADGPTTILDNGKRRSGRVNAPAPPVFDKATPKSKKHVVKTPASKGSVLKNAQTAPQTSQSKPKETPVPKRDKTPPRPSRVSARIKLLEASPEIVKKEDPAPPPHSPQAKRKAGRPPKADTQPTIDSQLPASPENASSNPRIKLKLKRPQFSFVPQHPGHVVNPPMFQSLDDIIAHYDRKSKEAVYESKEDDRYQGLERRAPERVEQAPEERAEKEALARLRILEAAQPGGLLSEEKSSLYLPDDQKEPAQQYNHWNYLWTHGAFLRSLMDKEKRAHMDTAKRVAYACLAKWKERQPQTEEEKEKQENEWYRLIYRQTVKDVQRKWELVGAEIDRRRALRYEEEQRIERELKMQSMLEKSTNLLDKRRALLDSGLSVDGDDDADDISLSESASDDGEGSDASIQDLDEDHRMTSSESEGSDAEEGEDDDVNLSPEALRRKYSNIPDLPQEQSEDEASDMDMDEDQDSVAGDVTTNLLDESDNDESAIDDVEDNDKEVEEERDYSKIQLDEVDDALLDDSDESTNMSDEDMSDDEEDDENDDEEEEDESESEDDGGLLGFFGGRKALATEAQSTSGVEVFEDAEETLEPQVEMLEEDKDVPDGVELDESSTVALQLKDELRVPSAEVAESQSEVEEESAASAQQKHPRRLSADMDTESVATQKLQAHSLSPHHNMLSADSHAEDRSSQTSPKDDTTIEPTEAESTTSVDLDEADRMSESSETPQPGKSSKVKIPSLLRGTLREYQHEGLDWLAKLYANQTNGILADEMGLGKTIQTIALLAHLAEEHHIWGPHLIVVPTSVILNWEMEFKKFLPGFKVLSYYGSVEERAQKRKGWSNPDIWNVVITSYQLILKDLPAIRVPEWHYMILDEAHNIKNFNSQRYQAMIRLKTHARLLLTGTPLQNSIIELWSLLTFLTAGQDGQGMGDLEEFTEWFRRPVDEIFVDGKSKLGNEAQDIVNKLHHSLRPYLLRRLKSSVEKQLPGKYEHTMICRLSKRQRQLYDAFMGLSDTKAKLTSGNMISVSQALMSLRKVCNHPDLFEERPIVTSYAMKKPYTRQPRSIAADFEITDLFLRRKMLYKDPHEVLDLNFLSINLTSRESRSRYHVKRSKQLRASRAMDQIVRREVERLGTNSLDSSSFTSVIGQQNHMTAIEKLNRLRQCAFLTEQRTEFAPVYGTDLIERCTTYTTDRLRQSPPRDMVLHSEWYLDSSSLIHNMVKSVDQRSAAMNTLIRKFACITPNAVASDILPYMVPRNTIYNVQSISQSPEPDAFHESRVRLSIAFPDKRLLQYDCGKLQRLADLLRELQSRGSRALIFTQMTSVLDILEQFLNIHGYRYLRLDGSTKIEQRQDMMERFNRDTRIDVFILSSRSGGVGMNLTGADTVIFYDLDWNPQMDKQCQDRAHRIGQTRDVHIYKFVSEHTIEVNILRKSNQKRLLDEVVIQEGEFTTDYFNAPAAGVDDESLGDAFAGAAVERVFGNNVGEHNVQKVLEAVEDAEDVAAAHAQQREGQADDFDFDGGVGNNTNNPTANQSRESKTPKTSVPPTPAEPADPMDVEVTDAEEEVAHVDSYMLKFLDWAFKDVKYIPPPDKSRRGRLDKNGRDRSHRPRVR
jgi:helicase SWR1